MSKVGEKNTVVVPYKQSDATKKEQIQQMFDNVAQRYDFLNRLFSLGLDQIWRKKAINELKTVKPMQKVLDMATGTADIAIAIAKSFPDCYITGADLSEEMLVKARAKINTKKLNQQIELHQIDAENMPYEDNSFDAITVAFGVRNFENLEKGLSEFYRVLRKGGKVVILEFSKPKSFLIKQLYAVYNRYIVAQLGRIISKDDSAYAYLPESIQAFPEGEAFNHILTKTGFNNTKWIKLTFGICSVYTGIK